MNQPHIPYLHCAISSATHNHELLIALLMQQGFDGFEEKDNQLLAFVAKNQFDQEEFNQFVASNQDLINGYPQMEELQDINWNAKWESEYQPVIID